MNSKLLIALLLCGLLVVPSVLAVSQNNPASNIAGTTRWVAAKAKLAQLKTVAATRLQNLNIAATPVAVSAMTDDQLEKAIRTKVVANLPAWKTAWKAKRITATPAVKNLMATRLVAAQKMQFFTKAQNWVENKTAIAQACKDQLDSLKTLATEATTDTVLVSNLDDATEDQTTVANADPSADLTELQNTWKEARNCFVKKRLETALLNAEQRLQNRLQVHQALDPKISDAIIKLRKLEETRESNALTTDFSAYQTALAKLKELNTRFIDKIQVLQAAEPATAKEKVHWLNKVNNLTGASHKFVNAVRNAFKWFLKAHAAHRNTVPPQAEVAAAQTDLTASNAEVQQVQTELIATVEELSLPSETDPVVVQIVAAESTTGGTA